MLSLQIAGQVKIWPSNLWNQIPKILKRLLIKKVLFTCGTKFADVGSSLLIRLTIWWLWFTMSSRPHKKVKHAANVTATVSRVVRDSNTGWPVVFVCRFPLFLSQTGSPNSKGQAKERASWDVKKQKKRKKKGKNSTFDRGPAVRKTSLAY